MIEVLGLSTRLMLSDAYVSDTEFQAFFPAFVSEITLDLSTYESILRAIKMQS